MSLNEIHLVLAKDAKGVLKTLYVGEDSTQAEAKYEGVKEDFQIVGILNFPVFSRQRNPSADAERQNEREQFVLSAEEAEQKRKEIEADNLRQQAEALLKKAETISPTPEVETDGKKHEKNEE